MWPFDATVLSMMIIFLTTICLVLFIMILIVHNKLDELDVCMKIQNEINKHLLDINRSFYDLFIDNFYKPTNHSSIDHDDKPVDSGKDKYKNDPIAQLLIRNCQQVIETYEVDHPEEKNN